MGQVSINVPEKVIEDILVSAFEGGIGYWAEISGYKNRKPQRAEPDYLPDYITTPLSEDGILLLEELEENNKKLELNREKLFAGIQIMANKYPRHFADMTVEDGDSTTGDVLVQCAIFGEVKYG